MPITTIGRAVGRRTVAIAPEGTAFGQLEPTFDADKVSAPIIDLDTTGLRTPAIDNESTRTSSYGRQPSGRGKKSQSDGFSFGGYFEGATNNGAPASASTDTVLNNVNSYLLGSLSGQDPVIKPGSEIVAAPAPTTAAFTATTENQTAGPHASFTVAGRDLARSITPARGR